METHSLPTGTVTFLFTDIEGSTKLWQQHPNEMPGALDCHHAILNEKITAHGGYVFQIIGAAFCAAFSTVRDGLDAALTVQRALRDTDWSVMDPIRVRMALHTGTAEVRVGEHTSGEYVSGLTLSRAARLLSAGHGGQILLSLPSAELVRDQLPSDVALRDLDAHRLKDLIRPEHIYQVVVSDLRSEFPPIKTLDTQPNNLPIQLTSFIGREQEMDRIKELLAATRLLTLTGAGGSGKTRLALQIAADLIDTFSHGVWFVEFAPISDPSLIPNIVATALGLQLQPGFSIHLELMEYLRERNCLLLFDNCEHLIDACASLIDTLLHACHHLKIFVTSRERLDMAGEVVYLVPSLAIPSLDNPTLYSLEQNESVRLFCDRAATIQPNFMITNQNAAAIAKICNHLDGIPLAIELAAARVNILSPEQISERLIDRFRLLTGGSRSALPRHQTLRALIDWSYSLLSQKERILFERVSIFTGGWTLEAAESVCSGDGIESAEVLDLLQNLAVKSLIVASESIDGRMRYHLLETIRQYAFERLSNLEQLKRLRDRHLDWFLDFEEQARPKLFSSEQVTMLNRLDAEHDNLRAALGWSLETSAEKGLRLAAGLYRFWRLRGYWSERLNWLTKLLSHPDARVPTSTKAYAYIARGDLELSQGEYADAEESFAESLQIYRQLGDEKGIVMALSELTRLSFAQGNYFKAGKLSRESLHISQKIQDKFQISQALNHLAYVFRKQGDKSKAYELLNESVNLFSQMEAMGSLQSFFSSPESENPFYSLALCEQDQGNFERARRIFEDGLAFYRKKGDSHEIAWFLRYLANLSFRQRDLSSAQALYEESLKIVQDMKDKYCTAHTLEGLARVENIKGNPEQSILYAHQSLSLCEQVGSKPRIAQVQCILGLTLLNTDLHEAENLLKSSLSIRHKLKNKSDIAESLQAFARMYLLRGSFELATQMFAAASTLRKALSYTMTLAERLESDRELGNLRSELGIEAFNTAWDAGLDMPLDQVINIAISEVSI